MTLFTSEAFIPAVASDISGVLDDLAGHFRERGYRVSVTPSPNGAWALRIEKGHPLLVTLGLKTALRIELSQRPGGIHVRADHGIVRSRVLIIGLLLLIGAGIPVLSWIIVAPLLLIHTWGFLRQAALDNEAIKVGQVGLDRRARLDGTPRLPPPTQWGSSSAAGPPSGQDHRPISANGPITNRPTGRQTVPIRSGPATETFCTRCGTRMVADVQFCGDCGLPRH